MRDRRPNRVRGRTWPTNPRSGDVWMEWAKPDRLLVEQGCDLFELTPGQARALHRNLGAALAAWDGRELRIAARQPKEGGKP